jgi:ribosomal protein S18 acetylase RimI-like enzyme
LEIDVKLLRLTFSIVLQYDHGVEINFRLANPRDLPQLLEWMEQSYKDDALEFNLQIAQSAWDEVFRHPELGTAWIILQQQTPVGYALLSFGFSLQYKGRDAYLDELYISDDFRGKGIGASTMRFLEDYCRGQGIQAIHLEVARQNLRAQKLYRKAGFQDHDHYLLTKWLDR